MACAHGSIVQIRLLHRTPPAFKSVAIEVNDDRTVESWQENNRTNDDWLKGPRGPEWWTGR